MSIVDHYFIAADSNDETWIWRGRGDYPVPVLARHDFRDAPDLWDVLTAALTHPDTDPSG